MLQLVDVEALGHSLDPLHSLLKLFQGDLPISVVENSEEPHEVRGLQLQEVKPHLQLRTLQELLKLIEVDEAISSTNSLRE